MIIILLMFLVLELLLRMGVYNPLLKPTSYLGSSYERLAALKDFGLNDIDWITTGDSRIDWGINHEKLRQAQKQRGVNHLRMSFGGADFMVLQSLIDWSIKHMDSLDGVVLGVSEHKLTNNSTFTKLYPIAWPFRESLNFERYNIMPADLKRRRHYYGLAVVNYISDIKDFITNPLDRIKELKKAQQQKPVNIFDYNNKLVGDLCAYSLDSPESCIQTAKQLMNKKPIPSGFKSPVRLCGAPNAKLRINSNRTTAPIKDKRRLINGWRSLIRGVLNKDKKLLFVLLPDHEMYNYLLKPKNAHQITKQIIAPFKSNPNFMLLDLREFIPQQEQCKYYNDPLHLNDKGGRLLTKKVIQKLIN
ncbi:hypothetical protein C8D91_0087 [Marinicella litoralis]|uniref:SGNH/GDSL hydrolase family protein n=2 Tax=Marinicella litoralis TaxID=644220 RepID=A0A4R6XYC9_9GAMM|nr:hypothetical protein C8D91_0087 [Marinicella litoralis]